MALKNNPLYTVHDDYFTSKEIWTSIQQFIPKDKIIWEAFYNVKSKSPEYLKELGFNVISKPVDFFENNLGDIVVSNPPYSRLLKKKILTRLKELNKPFILILPISTMANKYMSQLFKNDKELKIIIPNGRLQFTKLTKEGELKQTKNCAFNCIFICWKIDLLKDQINYL